MNFQHVPVLLKETIEFLDLRPGKVIVDGTLGGGGHALEILRNITPGGFLIGMDRDPEALKAAEQKLKSYKDCFVLIHDNYVNVGKVLDKLGILGIDGMIMDLGVSSYQLDKKERGFSYKEDAPLDMRMDQTQTFSAYHVVNQYTEQELAKVLWEYGEERWAKRIAQFIVKNRPIKTTDKLVDVIKNAIPAGARREGPHPAKRTFQAIRIEVNQELVLLEDALKNAVDVMKPGGRLCVITFHSLEDRIVKHTFKRLKNPCICPPNAPICMCGKKPVVDILTRKPVIAGKDELNANPRSRSAKLRACQKI